MKYPITFQSLQGLKFYMESIKYDETTVVDSVDLVHLTLYVHNDFLAGLKAMSCLRVQD